MRVPFPHSSHCHQHLLFPFFLITVILTGVRRSRCGLDMHFLMVSNVGHLYICVGNLYVFFGKMFSSSAYFLIRLFVLLVLCCRSSLYILVNIPFLGCIICKYLLPFSRLPIRFVSGFLCYAKTFYFGVILIIFVFLSLARGDIMRKKNVARQLSENLLLEFSIVFMV